jgi:hypothetical protein
MFMWFLDRETCGFCSIFRTQQTRFEFWLYGF